MLPVIDTMSAAETREEPDGHEEVEEEQPARKRKISLSHCGVCGSEEAKYRCPACLTHSCSLSCVKRHKEASGCSGVRDKTAFVSLTQFNEMNLLSDYRFLEDTSRFADGATRDDLVRTRHTTLKAKKLAASARKMNITLRFLPVSFTKSRENSTFFFTKEKQFMWHLKLVFPQSSSEFSQRRVSDRQTLKQILTSYIHPTESDPVTRQKLKTYVRSSFDHVKVFMKAEGRKANSVRFHELDIEKSLRDNLSYKMLIEYPVLHVVCREHWKDYPLKGPAGTKTEGVNQQDDVKESGSNIINTTTRETELKPPTQKRVKTGDLEEGEVVDSSDEDEEEDENSCDVNKDAVGDNLDADVGIRVNTDDASAADAMKQPEPVDTHH